MWPWDGARALFWPFVIAVAILFCAGLRVVTQEYLGLTRYLTEAPMIAMLSTVMLTPPLGFLMRHLVRADAEAPSWLSMAAYVFVASMATSTLRHALKHASAQAAKPKPGAAPEITDPMPEARLIARLAPALRGAVIRLQMRDHYVEVVTEAGSTTLLMRFADAMAELGTIDGLQVHRSHWVARDAITRISRRAGKITLQMRDGAVVPVSRSYQARFVFEDVRPMRVADLAGFEAAE